MRWRDDLPISSRTFAFESLTWDSVTDVLLVGGAAEVVRVASGGAANGSSGLVTVKVKLCVALPAALVAFRVIG